MAEFTATINDTAVMKRFAEKYIRVKANLNKALPEIGIYMEGKVKDSIAGREAEHASVDTGRFLNSPQSFVNNESLTVQVSSEVEYGHWLEYGTSTISPRPHFGNTLKRAEPVIKEVIEDVLKQS